MGTCDRKTVRILERSECQFTVVIAIALSVSRTFRVHASASPALKATRASVVSTLLSQISLNSARCNAFTNFPHSNMQLQWPRCVSNNGHPVPILQSGHPNQQLRTVGCGSHHLVRLRLRYEPPKQSIFLQDGI